VLGFALAALLLYILRDNKRFIIFSLLYSLAILFFCILPLNTSRIDYQMYNYISSGNYSIGGRYWFVTLLIMQLMLSVALVRIWKKGKDMFIPTFITAAIAFTIIGRLDMWREADYTVNYKQFAPLYSNTGTYRLRIPFMPGPTWAVNFPSNDYTQSPNVINTKYTIDSIDIETDSDWVKISGWMFDSDKQTDFKYVMIEINGTYYPMIKTNGQDIADQFQLNNIRDCRFNGMIPKHYLQTGENTLNIIGVHANKTDYALIKHTFSYIVE